MNLLNSINIGLLILLVFGVALSIACHQVINLVENRIFLSCYFKSPFYKHFSRTISYTFSILVFLIGINYTSISEHKKYFNDYLNFFKVQKDLSSNIDLTIGGKTIEEANYLFLVDKTGSINIEHIETLDKSEVELRNTLKAKLKNEVGNNYQLEIESLALEDLMLLNCIRNINAYKDLEKKRICILFYLAEGEGIHKMKDSFWNELSPTGLSENSINQNFINFFNQYLIELNKIKINKKKGKEVKTNVSDFYSIIKSVLVENPSNICKANTQLILFSDFAHDFSTLKNFDHNSFSNPIDSLIDLVHLRKIRQITHVELPTNININGNIFDPKKKLNKLIKDLPVAINFKKIKFDKILDYPSDNYNELINSITKITIFRDTFYVNSISKRSLNALCSYDGHHLFPLFFMPESGELVNKESDNLNVVASLRAELNKYHSKDQVSCKKKEVQIISVESIIPKYIFQIFSIVYFVMNMSIFIILVYVFSFRKLYLKILHKDSKELDKVTYLVSLLLLHSLALSIFFIINFGTFLLHQNVIMLLIFLIPLILFFPYRFHNSFSEDVITNEFIG